VLFQLRKNTGYCDGMWSLVSGHVEDGECATSGMIREAHEEIGITLSTAQIKVVHVCIGVRIDLTSTYCSNARLGWNHPEPRA